MSAMEKPDNVISLPMEELVLIKPGAYTAIYIKHVGSDIYKAKKLKVVFRLIEHMEILLPRWYRVTTYKGRVSAPIHSDLVREVSAALGQRIRHDRIPVGSLEGIVVDVEVSTVERDHRPAPLDEVNRYSVISRVKGKA